MDPVLRSHPRGRVHPSAWPVSDSFAAIAPVLGFFVLGLVLSRTGVASESDGHFLLRLLFLVALPSLTLVTLVNVDLRAEKALLPLGCALVNLAGLGLAWAHGVARKLPRPRFGAAVLAAMILNNAFLLPFVSAGFGEAGLADLILFDVGNALMVSLVAFPLAFRLGGFDRSVVDGVRRALSAPLTWAIAIGVVLSVTSAELPTVAAKFLSSLGALTGPMVLMALGILFRPSRDHAPEMLWMVSLRMIGGLLAGIVVVLLLGFDGDTRTIVLLAAASPIGFTALTLASMASLDAAAAARAVSASLLVGIVVAPIAIGVTT